MKARGRGGAAVAAAALLLGLFSCGTLGGSPPAPGPVAVAHRGGAGLAPENTLAAFRAGLESGADALELDVHLTRDGHLVVIHDAATVRTTNVVGEVGEMTLAEIERLDASARSFGPPVPAQRIPTFAEVLELARGRASVQVEIKLRSDGTRYPGIEAAVAGALRQAGMSEQATILSFDFATLQDMKRIDPGLRTCALITTRTLETIGRRGPTAVAGEMAALGVDSVGVDKRWLSENLYRELRSRRLGVGVWTVDNETEMRRFAEMGVDFITSNKPDLLRQVLHAGGR